MSTLTPTAMNSTGQFGIAQPGDVITNTSSATTVAIQKGNGSGGMTDAVQGNDFQVTLYSSSATTTVTNTVTETSAIGSTGVGSKTLPVNFFNTAGKTLRISGSGIYSAAAVAPGNLTIKIKAGSTILATATLGALLSGASSLGYQFEAEIVCRTAGSSGTVMTSGSIDYATTSTGTRSFGDLNNGGATSTIDTTATQVIDVTVTWQTASTSNIINNLIATIEVLW